MAKGIPHFFKNGKIYLGEVHKMPDGSLHSGKKHMKSSKPVMHLSALSKTARARAIKEMK
tara:strand:- start:138 stop:317 length:180 start_codon:yes stop_codon:yes gene_type:complete